GVLQEGSLGLSTLPRLGPEEGGGSEQVEALASLFAGFRVFDVDVHAICNRQDEAPAPILSNDASNLTAYLRYLLLNEPDLFDQLQVDARSFLPGLERLEFAAVGGSSSGYVLQLIERGLSDPTELYEASFGSIRALALLALLYDPRPPKL